MKASIRNLALPAALIATLGLMPVGQLTAQTFTTLHGFTNDSANAIPVAGLTISGNTLYGTATDTRANSTNNGMLFAVNTDGTGFTNLYIFTATSLTFYRTNSDGAKPYAGLILSGNTLYGTAEYGGSSGNGTVFAVNTDGSGFTNLHNFTAIPGSPDTNSDGANPYARLILSGDTLYGTAQGGGSSGNGTVFAVNTDGTGFTNLHSFALGAKDSHLSYTNSDGASPTAGLISSGNTLYGTAEYGGSSGKGTVFAVNTDGTRFTNLHSFGPLSGSNNTNSDGANPIAGLILSGNTLYGTAIFGGSSGAGTVFAVNTNGTIFMPLHSFTAHSSSGTNRDGANPVASLILTGNTLYGTAADGGSSGSGTVFALNTDGTGFTNLHSFPVAIGDPFSGQYTNGDGANPIAGLILSGNTLYGTAEFGGSSGNGTVFSLSLGLVSAPQLSIIPSGTNVILTWPTNAAGFILQSTTNLVSPAVWSTNLPSPVVVNGQNTVTNAISGMRKFYRLSQ
jgi:uncharacterized repeat protein (TIGR03803 family)